jgi:hypothetical protein
LVLSHKQTILKGLTPSKSQSWNPQRPTKDQPPSWRLNQDHSAFYTMFVNDHCVVVDCVRLDARIHHPERPLLGLGNVSRLDGACLDHCAVADSALLAPTPTSQILAGLHTAKAVSVSLYFAPASDSRAILQRVELGSRRCDVDRILCINVIDIVARLRDLLRLLPNVTERRSGAAAPMANDAKAEHHERDHAQHCCASCIIHGYRALDIWNYS